MLDTVFLRVTIAGIVCVLPPIRSASHAIVVEITGISLVAGSVLSGG